MSVLPDRLATLSPAKRALLLEKLQAQKTQQAPSLLTIAPVDRNRPLPLSFSQQRLWFLSQFEGSQSAYNIPLALRWDGVLQEPALLQSFQTIVERHEVLRTHFGLDQGNPIQIIADRLPLPLERLDWRSFSAEQIEPKLADLLRQEAHHRFDLQRGSLFRVVLIQTAPTVHYLITTFHHVITDAWSMNILVQELIVHYRALIQDTLLQRKASPPPLAIQYADYAVWQRQWLTEAAAQQQLTYWKTQLSHLSPLLELPTDRPRPPMQSFRGRSFTKHLHAKLTAELKALSSSTSSTLFMVLEAAFALLLSRFSRQTDVAIGTPSANRTTCDLEPLIGFFVNTLVLRNDLSGNPTVRELIQRTKQMALNAYRHQDIPFEHLVEAVQPVRTLSHSPIFQVMFGLQNTPSTALELPNLSLTPVPMQSETAKFDLTLLMVETADRLEAFWEYNCDLFEAETLDRLADHFQTLLSQMVRQPDAPISTLSLLSPTDRQQIVYNWNATAVEFAAPFLLHGGFEAQVQQTPHAIALIYEAQTLTYRELNDRANQFAHHLHQQGVTTDVLVGVYVERSPEMVIGVLAILKAGGAYVPLDPTYPAERIADMIADAQVPIILAQTHLVEKLPDHAAQVICLDQPATIASYPTTNLDRVLSPDQLAYVIYTSGSTGKPKGVMISHRGAVNTNLDINQRFRIGSDDRVIGLASLSFDLSVYDIFGFLAAGGAIVIPHAQDALNPTRWLQLMHQHQVTFWNTAPAVMEMLMASLSRQAQRLPDSLRVVMMSGDAISLTLPEQIRSHASPVIEVYSFGGATEGSIWSIFYPIDRVEPEWTSIPYGKPLSNQRFHILDASLNPVPIGVAGELHIGGTGVALGYFKRSELTAQRFIRDPFFTEPNARLYKTGDLGRYLPDGTIQFLGRIDHQVKIRGFRIELGEIEAAVTQYAGVREAAIVVREDQPGSKVLCAYVVAQPGRIVEVAGVRQALRQQLPDYMVPSFIMLLDALPLTANGKVDRKALPKPEAGSQSGAIALPQTHLERQIAQIWAEHLQVTAIGLHDNFFDLGGHSLLMVKIHGELQALLNAKEHSESNPELNIIDLFQFPTIATLAGHLQHRQTQASATDQAQHRTEVRTTQVRTVQQSTAQQRKALRQQFRTLPDD